MSYAIIGFGKIGQALAHAFARKNIDVTIASRRAPEELAPQARAIGPEVVAKSLQDALEADIIILAVPFGEHREVAKALPSWQGKTVIDATNSAPLTPEELDGLPSSAFLAKSFTDAKVVKGFNHLIAATLASDPVVEGGQRCQQAAWRSKQADISASLSTVASGGGSCGFRHKWDSCTDLGFN